MKADFSKRILPKGGAPGLVQVCAFCDGKPVASIASVRICLLHKRRIEAIKADGASTHSSGRKPFTIPFALERGAA